MLYDLSISAPAEVSLRRTVETDTSSACCLDDVATELKGATYTLARFTECTPIMCRKRASHMGSIHH